LLATIIRHAADVLHHRRTLETCQSLCPTCPQSEDGKWNKFGGRLAWDKSAICCNNPAFGGTGNAKTGEDYVAAPNIDHTNVNLLMIPS